MPIFARARFAGFLRGLLGRVEDRAPSRTAASAAPASASAPASTPAAVSPNPSAPSAGGPDEIELPLTAVVASLPLDLRAKLMAVPAAGQTIRLQAELVIKQLAFGAVKISFGELRQLAPANFVISGGELDHKLVNLPLQEILPRVNSALLARRATRKVEVADEITGPFAERGRGFTFTTQPLKAPPKSAPAPSPTLAPEPPSPIAPSLAFRNVSPPTMAPQIPPRSITPAMAAFGASEASHPAPMLPLSSRFALPVADHGAGSNGSGKINSNGNGNGNGSSPAAGHGVQPPPGLQLGSYHGDGLAPAPQLLKMQSAPMPTSVPLTPPASPQPVQTPPAIFVALGDLCDHWPEDLKQEILCSTLAQANVSLDGAGLLPGLKRGRVVLPWKQLRQLAQPSSAASAHDHLELELPLKVIAPLFLASQKIPARPRARTSVAAEIPDLFFGFPQPPPAPVVAAEPPPKPADTNYYVWGEHGEAPLAEAAPRRSSAPQTDFLSRQVHPKEMVARAVKLPGVAGAVVAMQDGLRVASQVPAELNADTLAAFLPQIFERVNQCTRELRMGALNNVNFTVGAVPWKIFRLNAVYFAAFGRTGEPLPSAELAQLAGDLDRKK